MRWLGLMSAMLAFTCTAATGETVQERIKRDAVVMVEPDDPEMALAFRKARETLPAFLALARKPRRTTTNFAVKVVISDDSHDEYFWISRFKEHDGKFSGRIDNTPQLVKTVKFGQTITFTEHDIVDWLYMDRGRMQGNFTLCVLLKREPPEEASALRKQLGLACDP